MSLKALKKQFAEEDAARKARAEGGAGGFVKVLRDYTLLAENNNVIRMRFAQEFDEDAKNANADRGFGVFFTEHATPYKPGAAFRTARCTKESEGNCYGCERYAVRDEESKGWRPFQRGYVNAIAETKNEDGETVYVPFVWAQKARADVISQLMSYAEDEDTITDVVFKYTKTGEKTDTKYLLVPTRADVTPFDPEGVELYDLEKVSPNIPYEKQAIFYAGGKIGGTESTESTATSKPAAAKPATDDEDW